MRGRNITELVFILDHSGSMSGLESDTIGGFNAMIAKQKKKDGKAYVSETVEKLGNLPPSERKIVTKETHQGCLSFAITGFSELFKF